MWERGGAELSLISWTVDPIGLRFLLSIPTTQLFSEKLKQIWRSPWYGQFFILVSPEKQNFLKKWFLTHSCQRFYIIHTKFASHQTSIQKNSRDTRIFIKFAHFAAETQKACFLSKFWTLGLEFDRYPVWYRYQVPIPGICICMKYFCMKPVSVSVWYGRYWGYRYRFGIDMGDIGIGNPVSYRVF